jgi:uncharacterized paraquat-inducible protein A
MRILIALLVTAAFFCAIFSTLYFLFMQPSKTTKQKRVGRVCHKCGYCLTGNVKGICPECGTRIRWGVFHV